MIYAWIITKNGRRAQAVILIPLMIMLIVGGALASVNLSVLSQKRMELQLASDSAARAGAFVQAECITGIANMNYIVVVLNPVIIVLEALSAIPFMQFLQTIATFLKSMITSVINPVQRVIWNPDSWYLSAAPYATFASVLGQGLVNDSKTWSVMIPDRRLLGGNFLMLESKPIYMVTFGLYGNVYTRKMVNPKDVDPGDIFDPLSSNIIEGVGVFTFKSKVELPFPNLYGMLGSKTGTRDDSLFLYTISAAKPYYVRNSSIRDTTLDIYRRMQGLGLLIWSPINPWDSRLVSFDRFIKDAFASADSSGDKSKKIFDKIPIGKIGQIIAKLDMGVSSLEDIWNDLIK